MTLITISRQMCSLGEEIAAELARRLDCRLISRETIFAQDLAGFTDPLDLRLLQESPRYSLRQTAGGVTFKELLENKLREIAGNQAAVIVGMGAQVMFSDNPSALHIRTIASLKTRVGRVRDMYHVSDEEAQRILTQADKKHKRYVSTLYAIDLTDPAYYDLILNTDHLDVSASTDAIQKALEGIENRQTGLLRETGRKTSGRTAKPPVFKNAAEAEFAAILDMYQMEWEYEPKTFPIEWDAEGNVKMAFSPDFYLKKFDTYIEITTMNQKYVTTKNKKVKRLRELYPGIHINIVYKNDFNSLIARFKSE